MPRITADATPPKPEPKLDLLAEVQNSEQQPSTSTATETENDDDDVRESQLQQQETEKLPNLVIDRDDDEDDDDEDGKDVAGDAAARKTEEDANVADVSVNDGDDEEDVVTNQKEPPVEDVEEKQEGKRKSGKDDGLRACWFDAAQVETEVSCNCVCGLVSYNYLVKPCFIRRSR